MPGAGRCTRSMTDTTDMTDMTDMTDTTDTSPRRTSRYVNDYYNAAWVLSRRA